MVGVVVGVGTGAVGLAVTSLYLHRGIAHRSLDFSPGTELILRFLVWITTGIQRREWVAVHRYHHFVADSECDPHSPHAFKSFGKVRVLFGTSILYKRARRNSEIVAKYAGGLTDDNLDRWVFGRRYVGMLLLTLSVLAIFGPVATGVAFVAHMLTYLLSQGAINALGHSSSERSEIGEFSRNFPAMSVITFGESLHHNHHLFPQSPRLALAGQFDPMWNVVRAMSALRLANVTRAGERALRSMSATSFSP